jgi:predicted TIM-barrel fold metal-dependent hydrolase
MPVPLDYPIIDCDSHLSEDLGRLRELIDARYRHLAPRMMDQGHGEMFVLAGNYMPQPPGMSWGETTTPGGLTGEGRRHLKYAEGHVVGFDPKQRLELMTEQGVHGSVIFPSQGLFSGVLQNGEVAAAICRGVNRYIAEFCSADTDRLWNTATVPICDPGLAIREAKYAVEELNAVAIFSPSGLHGPVPLYTDFYAPFFDAMAELGVPFCTHTGAAVIPPGGMAAERFPGRFAPYHMTTHVCEAMIAAAGILSYGILDQRPELKVGFFEAGAGWAPFWIDKLHEKWEMMGWMMPEMPDDPFETFRDRCFVTVEAAEANLAATLDYFEGKAVGWSSDLPHFDCEDMGAPTALIENDDLTAEQKYRLLNANTVEFFGLKVPAAAQAAAE